MPETKKVEAVKVQEVTPVNNGDDTQLKNTIKGLQMSISDKDKFINQLQTQHDELNKSFTALKKTILEKGYEIENMPSLDEITKIKADYEVTQLRLKVAKEKNIPLKWVDRLRGTTKEEIERDASELTELTESKFKSTKDPKPSQDQKVEISGADAAKKHFAKHRK